MHRLRQHVWLLFGVGSFLSLILFLALAIYAWRQNYQGIESDLIHAHELVKSYYVEKMHRWETAFKLIQDKGRQEDKSEIEQIVASFHDIVGYERGPGPNFFNGELVFERDKLKTKKNNTLFAKNTFYYTDKQRWVTPFCYRYKEGDFGCFVVDFDKLSQSLNEITLKHGVIHLIATLDYWVMHNSLISAEKNVRWYGENLKSSTTNNLVKQHSRSVKESIGISLDELFASGGSHIYRQDIRTGEHTLIIMSGMPSYNIFLGSGFRYSDIWQHFLDYIYGMALLMVAFNVVLFMLFRRYDNLNEKHNKELEYRSMHDDLTGLLTRRASESIFIDEEPLLGSHIMVALSIDQFHLINERYGHSVGDSLLRIAARDLMAHCGNGCHLLRDNGPDFILISPGRYAEKSMNWIDAFTEAMEKPKQVEDIVLKLTVNAGIYTADLSEISYREALKRVDLALWKAKTEHSRFYVYTEITHQQVIQRSLIREQLEYGIENREFYVVYQPQIDTQTGLIVGVEALARWNSPVLGNIPPNLFIDIAEESGMIVDLGGLITLTALEQMVDVMAETREVFGLSINFSLYQLLYTDVLRELDSMVETSGFPKQHLTLEITESIYAGDVEVIRNILDELHTRNHKISLDDFGTGYSSLSMLSKLPVDEVKIDKLFIDGIHQSEADKMLVKNIIAIANTLDIKIVAEGVEFERQAEILREDNCHIIQGYLYSKPLNTEELKRFINNNRKPT
ncbi:MAG: bifunctional diguanylate cyclase/phosphodiesterase [Candidatus Thiodiazotropha endolucinida]